VLTRWQGWVAAVVVTLVTFGLVIVDLADSGFRRWWAERPLTTDTVAGLLVVLVTVLVVDQLVRRRQISDRSRAVAAQAAIMMNQAARSAKAVSGAVDGSGDREAASDEVRTYMIMLLVGAPVLIEAAVSRQFLEQAQHLGGEMARMLLATSGTSGTSGTAGAAGAAAMPAGRLDDAVERLRAASAPLLRLLNPEERVAAGEQES
jgi:hypothetical protein